MNGACKCIELASIFNQHHSRLTSAIDRDDNQRVEHEQQRTH